MMFPNYPDVVTVKEVSEMLHLSTKKVYQLVKAKGYKCDTDKGNATASHKLLHTL